MSTLSSTSTDAEVEAAYDDNASYREDESTSKAKAFATACRLLLRRLPSMMREASGAELRYRTEDLRAEQNAAEEYVELNGGSSSPRVTRVDFRPGRE